MLICVKISIVIYRIHRFKPYLFVPRMRQVCLISIFLFHNLLFLEWVFRSITGMDQNFIHIREFYYLLTLIWDPRELLDQVSAITYLILGPSSWGHEIIWTLLLCILSLSMVVLLVFLIDVSIIFYKFLQQFPCIIAIVIFSFYIQCITLFFLVPCIFNKTLFRILFLPKWPLIDAYLCKLSAYLTLQTYIVLGYRGAWSCMQ